ncbi:hypothetical protein L6452_04126 [Arctium lappa]|uniref:Uncharacterized protein n=1 Tax=Arctium lappa TaxID=4217 RepID=A0ACB9FQ48_ARCLA|nr:hypothetical protein L6452_04126 [Arctium lappa]
MPKNTRKFKSNPGNNSLHNIQSSSIRDIIGDRRFNGQFSHVNTHGTEALKKVKRMKVGEAETDDLPNLGRNASSIQFEAAEDPRRCCGDFSAKTSEYAFFKKMKENTCSNVNVHRKYHDNQLDNVQQSDHFTREEIHDVQKDIIKYDRSSFHVEKERADEAHYSFLSPPCCGSKKSEVNHAFRAGSTSAPKVRPGEYNWLSPSVGSKTKTSGDKGVFSAKREKLRHWVADKSLNETNELSSKGFDLVSVLISRILPKDQENNCRREQTKNGSKCKLPSFSEPEAATPITSHEGYKRKLTKSHHISNLDDGFSRSRRKLVDMDLLEWDLTGLESWSAGQAPKSSFQYDRSRTEDGFRIPNFAIESILSFDKPLSRYESSNVTELEELDFDNGPKLLEQPRTLLLGWENDSFEDGFHLSELNSQKEINTFSDDDYQLCVLDRFISSPPPSPKTRPDSPYYLLDGIVTPYIDRHLEEKHVLSSSYAPKHLMLPLEDCSINIPTQDHTWCPNDESLNEKERDVDSESFLFLIQSPANNLLRFLNTGLRSFVVDDENDENFVYGPDRFLEGRVKGYHPFSFMESFHDKHFDHIGYPLLLHDSSKNE